MKNMIKLLIIVSVVALLIFACEKKEDDTCVCVETTYYYDSWGEITHTSEDEVSCPDDMEDGETRNFYYGNGNLKSSITMNCD